MAEEYCKGATCSQSTDSDTCCMDCPASTGCAATCAVSVWDDENRMREAKTCVEGSLEAQKAKRTSNVFIKDVNCPAGTVPEILPRNSTSLGAPSRMLLEAAGNAECQANKLCKPGSSIHDQATVSVDCAQF